jgi:hypothetical protein
MNDSPPQNRSPLIPDRSRIAAGWPLLLAAAVWAVGLTVLPRLGLEHLTGTSTATLAAFALIAAIVGVIVLIRMPDDPATIPFVGLAATVATLLVLAPLDRPASNATVTSFLVVAPWRYALTPLVVHCTLEIGWAHRRPEWAGWVIGWYAVALAAFLVVTVGIVMNEVPLINAVDLTFRVMILEPVGALGSIVATALALTSPIRGRVLRTALGWTLAALFIGLVPFLLVDVVHLLGARLDGSIAPGRLALVALPVLMMIAVLSLPFRDKFARDGTAHRLAAALLEGDDLSVDLRNIAATLYEVFNARGVVVRLAEPETVVSVGEVPSTLDGPITHGMESDEDHHTLIAPIGRSANPLGEVRLEARFAGAFGMVEREWLGGFLAPIAAVLRARRREIAAVRRNDVLARQLSESMIGLSRAAEHLPLVAGQQGIALPPAVDAREVLAQLSDGVTGIARHGEGLTLTASEARDCARGASDLIARALDALGALNADISRLARYGEDIAASNDTVSGVAFRTNLVANNAALEATRAGAAGRTFGVLAEEVRRLADTTAATSAAIEQRTAALSTEVAGVGAALEATRHALSAAIRQAEAAEAATQRLNDAAGELEDAARSLRPAVAEADAVAKRRTARDQHLTVTMERFISERAGLSRALGEHRAAMERLVRNLGDLAQTR